MFEPVLIASNPAVHIEQLRPMVRVVMSDAVKQFAVSLVQSRPVLKAPDINELVDHIIHPHRKARLSKRHPGPSKPRRLAVRRPVQSGWHAGQERTGATQRPRRARSSDQAPARARAIFQAAEELKPFDPADLSFAFDEKAAAEAGAALAEAKPPKRARRWAGMTVGQWIVLVIMLLVAVRRASGCWARCCTLNGL